MIKIILILSYYFCYFNSCAGQRQFLTAEEIRRIFGADNHSAGVYGKVDIPFPVGDSKISWSLKIPFSTGSIVDVHLKLTDGILADSSTPVAGVRTSPDTDKITYTVNRVKLGKLGDSDFYQDFDTRCSLVVFHSLKRIEGFLGFYRFIQYNSYETPEGILVTQHVLVRYGKTLTPLPSNFKFYHSMNRRVKREVAAARSHSKTSTVDTVYPQLLIQAAYPEKNQTFRDLTIQILTQWNAVDMMYSNFSNPAIKINIAGIILPKTDVLMPWWRDVGNGTDNDYNKILHLHGKHFEEISHIFPPSDFDQLFVYFRRQPGHWSTISGLAMKAGSGRRYSVGLLEHDMYDYTLAAHELGHVFGAKHDGQTACPDEWTVMSPITHVSSMAAYHWSSCAVDSIQSFLNDERTSYFRNCPRTQPDCHKPAREKPFCVRKGEDVCRQRSRSNLVNVDCKKGVLCRRGANHFINIRNTDRVICSDISYPDVVKACLYGECVVHDPSTPTCPEKNPFIAGHNRYNRLIKHNRRKI